MLEMYRAHVVRGGRTVLDVEHVSFETGVVTAVVGPNGAGKTTLLRALIGLEAHGGSVLVDGIETVGLAPRQRARLVAYLPQGLGVPAIDAERLVSHGRFSLMGFPHTLSDRDRKMVHKAMERTGTYNLRERRMAALSGGERQRVWLAMALAQQTPVLLLDEPGSAQDVSHRRELSLLLGKLATDGKTIVVTSHDVAESASMADRICLVAGGRVAFDGTPDELVASPEVLRAAMGVTLVPMQGEGLLHRFALAR